MKGIGIQLTNYTPRISVKRDRNGRITQGLTVGNTLRQNQALLLVLHSGELKDNPAVGVGISDMLLDHHPLYWRTKIREQLRMDGQTVRELKLTTTGLRIEAEYDQL